MGERQNSPPESGGEAEPKAKRGGSTAVTPKIAALEPPLAASLRDTAALLTQEGSPFSSLSNLFITGKEFRFEGQY